MPHTKLARIPAYRLHRPSGLAVVRLAGKDFYLGKHGSTDSRRKYERLIAEWLANDRPLTHHGPEPLATDLTVNELILRFMSFVHTYYVKDGRPTSEQGNMKQALRQVTTAYGNTRVGDFGPLSLKAVREQMVNAGNARTHINDQIARIKLMFKWGVAEELLPSAVHEALRAVGGVKKGRCRARETDPIRPVLDEHVDALRDLVSRQVWAMIELQRLTGMRPGEVVTMRGCDIDMVGDLWLYHPASRKTEHHGQDRVIELGPRAVAVVRPFLKSDLNAYLFSPADAEAERKAVMRVSRKSRVQPSQWNRAKMVSG